MSYYQEINTKSDLEAKGGTADVLADRPDHLLLRSLGHLASRCADEGEGAVLPPVDPGLKVWQVLARWKGSSQKFAPFPSKTGYRFVRASDAEPTLNMLQRGRGPHTVVYEAKLQEVFLPFVRGLVEVYCQLCGVQTGNYTFSKSERRQTVCSDCRWQEHFSWKSHS